MWLEWRIGPIFAEFTWQLVSNNQVPSCIHSFSNPGLSSVWQPTLHFHIHRGRACWRNGDPRPACCEAGLHVLHVCVCYCGVPSGALTNTNCPDIYFWLKWSRLNRCWGQDSSNGLASVISIRYLQNIQSVKNSLLSSESSRQQHQERLINFQTHTVRNFDALLHCVFATMSNYWRLSMVMLFVSLKQNLFYDFKDKSNAQMLGFLVISTSYSSILQILKANLMSSTVADTWHKQLSFHTEASSFTC